MTINNGQIITKIALMWLKNGHILAILMSKFDVQSKILTSYIRPTIEILARQKRRTNSFEPANICTSTFVNTTKPGKLATVLLC